MPVVKYLLIIVTTLSITTISAYAASQNTAITQDNASISAQQNHSTNYQYTPPQKNVWLDLFYAALPFLIVIVFIAVAIFFPVFTGFMSATAGLIIFGLLVLLLGSCFTGGISWEGGDKPDNIFNILLSHFYIYIGIVLIALDMMILGSIVVSLIGGAFIVWDIGSSIFNIYKGMHSKEFNEADLMVFGVLMSITTIVAFVYALRKQKNKKNLSRSHLYIGEIGTVTEKRVDNTYQVRINYEYWDAVSTDELNVGDNVEVVSIHNATLRVRKHFK